MEPPYKSTFFSSTSEFIWSELVGDRLGVMFYGIFNPWAELFSILFLSIFCPFGFGFFWLLFKTLLGLGLGLEDLYGLDCLWVPL